MAGNALLSADLLLRAAGVRPGMRVLDIGVGRSGHMVFPAASRVGAEGRVYGLDVDRQALSFLEGRRRQYIVHNIDFLYGDAQHPSGIPLDDNAVDVVFLVNMLWVLREPEEVLQEIERVLAPEGTVLVVEWHPETTHPVAPAVHLRIPIDAMDAAMVRSGNYRVQSFVPSRMHEGRMYLHD